MTPIQNDSFSADAITSLGGSSKDGLVRQGKKPTGFHSLLTQLGQDHGKPATALSGEKPSEKADPMTTGVQTDLMTASIASDVLELKDDGKASDDGLLVPDSASPVLWAQMQMGQAASAQQSLAASGVESGLAQKTGGIDALGEQTGANLATLPGTGQSWMKPEANPAPAQVADSASKMKPQASGNLPAPTPGYTPTASGDLPVVHASGHKLHGGSSNAQDSSQMTELSGLAIAAAAQKSAGEQVSPLLEEIQIQTQNPTPEVLVAAAQSTWVEGMQQRNKPSSMSSKGGFESGQSTFAGPGLDMSSLANQTAASLGISATIAVDAVPETAVATQVAVWVSQHVQSAELKLDAQGGDPVEVSISLAGNQATVEFRCDTPETREVLNRAADQLHAMLLSEGLVLSGVSVTASNQQRFGEADASQGQDAKGQQARSGAARNADGATAQTLNMLPRTRVPAGVVDLFV